VRGPLHQSCPEWGRRLPNEGNGPVPPSPRRRGIRRASVRPFPTAFAQTAPSLGQAAGFGVLAASAVTSTGPTVVAGDLGISPNNASSGHRLYLFALHRDRGKCWNDPTSPMRWRLALRMTSPLRTTISRARRAVRPFRRILVEARSHQASIVPQSTMGLTGNPHARRQGDPNAVFIFQVGSSLTTASASLVNGDQRRQ
jgi:hypothetical protein